MLYVIWKFNVANLQNLYHKIHFTSHAHATVIQYFTVDLKLPSYIIGTVLSNLE